MLALDDPRWRDFKGGYRLPYDASGPMKRLFISATEELWEEC